MKIQNPYQNVPYDRVTKDQRSGTDLYGYRNVEGEEEIVHVPSGKSNMDYWQPEVYLNPDGCTHIFSIVDMGKRELECRTCRLMTSFHPAVNYKEVDGKSYITLNYKDYEIVT